MTGRNTMKAVIFHAPRKVTTATVDRPAIGPADILIKVSSCCICGSDLHMYKLGLFTDFICRASEAGPIPGHEFSGEVAEIGREVKGLSAGDRVAAFTNGGMAEYVPVSPALPGINVFKIPDEVSDREAATLEPLGNSVHAVAKGNPAQGENAVVFGAGIIGLGVIQVLRAIDLDPEKVIAVDVSDKRLETALKVGATHTINAGRENVYSRVQEIAGTSETPVMRGMQFPKADMVFDCVGYIRDRPEPPVLEQGIMIVRPLTGRIVAHGVFEAPLTLDFSPLVAKQVQIIGSYGSWPEDTLKALELMRTKKIDRAGLISHEFSLDQVAEAFETSCTVENSIKVILNP